MVVDLLGLERLGCEAGKLNPPAASKFSLKSADTARNSMENIRLKTFN